MAVPGRLVAYEVGGAVRDALLGLPVHDRDWVVVGATPERMVELGFRPVGRDFPVFLHPETHEEYALARTERKTARGYRGFAVHASPDVSLEDDLRRRDLTINAMARAADGTLVDPWGGERDLRDGVLRHVSEAFAEDPVRILRLARFAARFERFAVAPETLALMRAMVAGGEVDALVPERVWQEVSRGLGEARPSRMLDVLRDAGALARLVPELDARWDARLARVVDAAARDRAPLAARFAALLHGLDPAAVEAVCARMRAPHDCRELARLAAAEHATVERADALDAAATLALIERCDAVRKPARFALLLRACDAISEGLPGDGATASGTPRLGAALRAARAVDAGVIAAEVARSPDPAPAAERIGAAVRAARQAAVRAALDADAG
ncbi:MAG: multifunctional CCA tRNA nucleotidyl transferase/2'3'-cyclic phosphodiesterase/2'nucleotidase/phosphatase [Burkholderiaceae bacterium]|nr:multifunctional CCA tRNA nucleotidyl transferase/2'3'-cyclic phosphodiesterase/2'nucleotidase/phosphatase [Burkholderiaceae bacterium]